MAKSLLRLKARELRSHGRSVLGIAKELNAPKSTISGSTRDIILSSEQLEALRQSELKGREIGRIKGALVQKQRRLARIKESEEKGRQLLGNLSSRDILIAGVALYWAGGSKKKRELQFCNSDPRMVQFLTLWLRKYFGVNIDQLVFWVGLNEAHRGREDKVKQYWSSLLNVSLDQFRKTSFKKVKAQKVYENFDNHFGTLYIRVPKSSSLCDRVIGLIKGMAG